MEGKASLRLFVFVLGLSYMIMSLGAAPLSRSLKLVNGVPLIHEVEQQMMSLKLQEEKRYYQREMLEEIESSSLYDYHTGANNHHDPKPGLH